MNAGRVRARLAALVAAVAMATGGAAMAAGSPSANGVPAIAGEVTSQRGVLVVAGASVTLADASGATAAATVSGEDGRFAFTGLAPGRYRLEVRAAGFRPVARDLEVPPGGVLDVVVDLEVAASERVAVVAGTGPAAATDVSTQASLSEGLSGTTIDEMDDVPSALRLLSGVSYEGDGLSIRGGRPTQTGLLLGGASVTEPSTGTTIFRVPADAFASVDVLPHPYSVEFGRFSAGIALLDTRRGSDTWRVRLNNFIPSLRTERGRPLSVIGLERFGPRLTVGGPLKHDRFYFSQAADYRYEALDVRSRPVTDVSTSHAVNTLTRVDATLPRAHRVTAWLNVIAQEVAGANMDTFTPPDSAARIRERVVTFIVADTLPLSDDTVFTSTAQASASRVRVGDTVGEGLDVAPGGVSGRFFNTQQRDTHNFQAAASVSRFVRAFGGQHLVKAGVDVMWTSFEGSSASSPVTVWREDGSLARRLVFGAATQQVVRGTDAAFFVQDHWRPTSRLLLEGGLRLDRDGVLGRTRGSVRLGGVLLVTPDGHGILRAGAGTFAERTPSIVGAFTQFEEALETRFDRQQRPLGPPTWLRHEVSGRLRSPASTMWNVGYEQRVGTRTVLRTGYLERRGRNEFTVQREDEPMGTALRLSSAGRSRYREVDAGLHVRLDPTVELHVGYVRASGEADLNDYAHYFGTLRQPTVGVSRRGPPDADVPHRLVARLRYVPGTKWLIAPVFEVRSGRPYAPVDAYFDEVPVARRPRFPRVTMVDLRVDRQVRVGKWRPWVGVHLANVLNAVDPRDVQRSTDSPAFGSFYDATPRRVRLQLRFR